MQTIIEEESLSYLSSVNQLLMDFTHFVSLLLPVYSLSIHMHFSCLRTSGRSLFWQKFLSWMFERVLKTIAIIHRLADTNIRHFTEEVYLGPC